MIRKLVLALIPVAVLSGPVLAQAADITAIDADADGLVSFDELAVFYPDLTDEAFIAIDVSGDGYVDATELADAISNGLLPAPTPAVTE